MNSRGSFTIESIIAISIVIIIMLLMSNFINLFFINEKINQALLKTALQINKSNGNFEKTFYDNYQEEHNLIIEKFDKEINKEGESLNLFYSVVTINKKFNYIKKLEIKKFVTPQEQYYVYITNTGSKYHLGACRYLYNSKIKVTMQYALLNGYSPCKICIGGFYDHFKD